MAAVDLEYNKGFQIYNANGTKFHDLVLHKCTYETVVMSLGDKISGILYYKDNALDVKMTEYIIYKGVKYTLVNPPTILKEGLVSDNGELKGMTKYSFTFYHPMYVLNNFPFNDVAVSSDQNKYLSQNKTFSWIGNLNDYVAKINKNLQGTEWVVKVGDNVTQEEKTKLSDVLSFDKNTIAEALKRGYETWEVPYIVDSIHPNEYTYIDEHNVQRDYYDDNKHFVVLFGLPTTEITVKDDNDFETPYVFRMGQGVGLKNNSRNPKNNKIITRIAGYGSEDNIPYGYPQIRYYGGTVQYPLYYGIVGGQRVQLIKHPFTRNHLMPSVYCQAVYNKVNPKLSDGSNNPNYNPNIELVDYYDADSTYANPIKSGSPSYEIHEFGDIKPELGEETIINAVPVNAQETQGDYRLTEDFLQEILDRISSTEIEDEKVCLKTLYDKVDAGLSYYAQKGEEGGREYWYRISVTSDDYYQYVSYESGNYNFTATVLKNDSSAPTPEWDDTMDDDGNYLQSYFKITLPILSFDLYACAAITQEMKINMRSGACIGCTFPVQVDWDDYKRNFYNSDGEFDPDGEQRDYTKYPDSSSGQITVMVKKELETFGTLMPNQYQQPTTGDKFVILGISLPNTYITNAEQRLDADMKQYMRDNNVYYYEYPLKFDEHFLISNEGILSQMKPNVVVRFEYAGETHALYIKQMSVKYNESPLPKYDITLTDDIEIVLNQIGQVTDEVSKLRLGLGDGGFGGNGQEYLRKDIDDTARGTIRMIKGMQVGERFVTGLLGEGGVFRKDSDGTTYLETDKLYVRMKAYFDTVEVKHYLHTGGNRIASQASGIVCSRVEMIDANNNLAMDVADAVLFRCFFKANDGDKTIRNDFMIGDLAFCRETNVDVSSVNLHGYWRLVIDRNVDGFLTENKEAWIDLSNRASETLTIDGKDYVCNGYQNGSDAPIAQDDIIQLGNIAKTDRQGAIVEYVGGEDAPSYQIFQGIGSDLPYPYTLEDKNYIGLGYSSQTGHAYMNVYGDVFIGAKPDAITGESPTYIKYVQEDPVTGEPKLTIKAVVEFQSPDDPQTTTTLDDFARAVVGDIDNIQSQIDGNIETWFYDYMPVDLDAQDPRQPLIWIDSQHTIPCLPYYDWWYADQQSQTNNERIKHLSDIFYDNKTGYAFRFSNTGTAQSPVFSWVMIEDSAVIKALEDAARAQDTADHKRRVFVAQPAPISPNVYVEYDIGDLWVNATYPSGYSGETDEANHKYNNDYLRCIVAKPIRDAQGHVTDGTFSINDWQLASKYTDDTALLEFLDGYQGTLTTIRNQVDAKAETWYQDEDPSTLTPQQGGWYGDDDAEHVGDIWFCTKNHASPSLFKKGTTWIWQPHTTEHGVSYAWEEQEIPDEVFDKIDGKSSIYANDPNDVDSTKRHPSNYKANDVWILPMIYVNGVLNPSTYTINNITYGAGEMLTALRDNETYSAGDWAKKVRYTDDSALEDFKTNQYVQLLTGGQITSDINSARQTADNAQTAAEAAQTSADNANAKLTDWASDSYISPTEKTALKTEWEDVKTEYTQICNDADKYSIDKTDFTSAYTSANAAFQKYTAATPENITVGSDYQNIKDYYAARQTILDAISDAAKTLAQNAATAYMSDTALNAIKYALNGGSTTQDGGLILSNIIALRDANQNVMSGMNGVYNSQLTSGGIAAWYGGAMTDHEQSPSVSNYAKSLFRFDGSGYLASGNITWDATGAVTIKNITTLSDSQNTNILNELATFNNAFTFATSGSGGTTVLSITPNVPFTSLSILDTSVSPNVGRPVATQKWVSDNYISIAFFNRLFQAYSSTAISDANKVAANDTTTTINNLKLLVGTWTNEYLSALGLNSSSSGGGGGDGTGNYLPLTGGWMSGDIFFSQHGSGTYTRCVIMPRKDMGFVIETPRKTDSGSAEILPFLVHTRGGQDAPMQVGNITSSGTITTSGVYGSGTSDRLVFRHIDGQNCQNDYNLYLQYHNNNAGKHTRVYFGGVTYYIDKGEYNGNAASATQLKTTCTIWGQQFNGTGNISGTLTADSIVKTGGTSSQFLKADGSVDSNSYALASSLDNYLPLAGGTMTGGINGVTSIGFSEIGHFKLDSYGNPSATTNTDNNWWTVYTYNKTESIVVKAQSGNVGIHTTSPTQKLEVNGNVLASSFIKSGGTSSQFLKADGSVDSNSYALASSLDNYLPLAGGTMTGSISSNARNILYDINGNYLIEQVKGSCDNYYSIGWGSAWYGGWDAIYAGKTMTFITGDTLALTTRMTITSGGDVGIGTTSPTHKLHVNGTLYTSSDALIDGTCNITNNGIGFNRMVKNGAIPDNTKDGAQINYNYDYNGIEFGTVTSNGLYTLRMLLKSDGNLGIGIVNPSYKLHVNGYTKTTRLYLSDTIYLEVANNGVHVVGGGLYADTYVSALGTGSGGSGGGVDMEAVWSALGNATTEQINASHLTNALAPYATQSWVNSQGFLTSISLSDYVTLSTNQIISGTKTFDNGCWIIASNEADEISSKHWENDTYYNNANTAPLYNLSAIRNAIRFRWYDSYWNIGNIRSSSIYSSGFGIALEDIANNRLIDCLRVTNYGTFIQGYMAWHAGNDGSGSGLDADLLDGQHGSYYASATALSNYLPLAGETMTGSISSNATYILNDINGNYLIEQQVKGGSDSYYSIGWGSASTGGWRAIYAGRTITFSTGTTLDTRMTITDGGDVGIGTSSPSTKLHVKGRITAEYDSTAKGSFCATRDSYVASFGVNSSGFAILACGTTGSTSAKVRLSLSPQNAQNPYVLISNNLKVGSDGKDTSFTDSSFVQIGAIRLMYDQSNNAIKVIKNDGTSANFYATGAVSALGANTSGGGGAVEWQNVPSNIIPTSNATYNLGSDSKRWGTVYANSGSFTGSVNTNGSLSVTGTSSFNSKVTMNGGLSVYQRVGINQEVNNNYRLAVTGDISIMSGRLFIGEDGQISSTHKLYVKSGTTFLDGNVGIGGYNSKYKLFVSGPSRFNGNMQIGDVNTSNLSLDMRRNKIILGDIWLYGNSQNVSFDGSDTDGGVTVKGVNGCTITAGSDIRQKNIIKHIEKSVKDIALAPVFDFTWKNTKGTRVYMGTSAQYWQKIFPESVFSDEYGYLSLDYGAVALASAVITARKVVDHELRIKQLEQENAILREEIKSLKAA